MTRYWLFAWCLFLSGAAAGFWQAAASGSNRTHRVGRGESLYSIACRYYSDGSRYRLLAAANRRQPPYTLKEGELLLIPGLPRPPQEAVWAAIACLVALLMLPIETAGYIAAGRALGGMTASRALEAAAFAALVTAGAGVWLAASGAAGWWFMWLLAFVCVTILRIRTLSELCSIGGRHAAGLYAASRPLVLTGGLCLLLATAAVLGERLPQFIKVAGMCTIMLGGR